MTKNLLKLFDKVRDKTAFVEFISGEFDKNPVGIRANWFSMGKIPERYQKDLHKYLIRWLNKEMKQVQLLINKEK